jgi:hypothetical protein
MRLKFCASRARSLRGFRQDQVVDHMLAQTLMNRFRAFDDA